MVRLGQPEAADGLTRRHPGQPFLLLFRGAVFPDREHGQRALDRDQAAQPGVGRFQLPAGDPVGDGAHPRAAVAGQVHAEQAQLAELGGQLTGQRAGLEPVGDVRHHPLGRERPHGVADQHLIGAQLLVDAQQVDIVAGLAGGVRGHGGSFRSFTNSRAQRMRAAFSCLDPAGPGMIGA